MSRGVAAPLRGLRGEAPTLPRPLAVAGGAAGVAAAVLIAGVLSAVAPTMAVGLVGLVVIVGLALWAPAAHLTLLIIVTAIVPIEIQNVFSIGGGTDSPGLLPADALILTGLAPAAVELASRPLDRRERLVAIFSVVILAIAFFQLVHGIGAGIAASEAGAEFRVMLALGGTALITLRLLADPGRTGRLLAGLVVAGLLIGLWGIVQSVFGLQFDDAEEALRTSSGTFLTAGRTVGQYAFPVCAVITVAMLTSGAVRSVPLRAVLIAVALVNVLALFLTFQRTFWVVTAVGIGVVAFRAGGGQRTRLLVAAPILLVLVLGGLSTLAPEHLTAARERLLSIGDYTSDPSVRYRIAESQMVLDEIRASPAIGAGFGATIFIGRPGTTVTRKPRRYAENGYLWLTWKLGIPAALFVLTFLLLAILRRSRADEDEDEAMVAVRRGAQGALAALVVATISFPSFISLTITPIIGLLAALCLAPRLRTAQASGPAR